MANDSRIGILIEAKANAAAIGQTSTELAGLDRAAGRAAAGMSSLSGALGIAGFVALGAAVGGAVTSLAEIGAQAGTTADAYENLTQRAGIAGAELTSTLHAATRNAIDDTNLQLTTNRALMLGVADSLSEFDKLSRIAIERGRGLGVGAQQALNDLVTGVGRTSAPILDNLAIIVDADQAYKDYALSVGKSVDALNEQERKQAFVNNIIANNADALRDSANATIDASTQIQQFAAQWENLKSVIGEGVAGALTKDVAGASSSLELLTQQVQALSSFGLEAPITLWKGVLHELGVEAGLTYEEMQQLDTIFGRVTFDAAAHAEALQGIVPAAGAAGAAVGNMGRQVAVGSDHLRDGAVAALEMRNALNELGAVAGSRLANVFSGASDLLGGGTAAFTQFERMNGALQTQIDLWGAAGKSADEVSFLVDAWIRTQADGFSDQRAALREAERGAASYGTTLSRAASDAASEFDDLKSKVAGVLQGAFADTAGVDVAGLLPREDAVAENARRLADIAVNGFKGQDWLGEFASAVPDVFKIISESGDPKAAAANVLKDFQDGLVPELIDKDRAKDLVRRMILGEQQADALAAEIAAELAAEFGAGAPADLNALVSQALGTGASGAGAGTEGGAQAGADAATSFAQSFATAASGVGAQIAASLKADSVIALIKDAGKAAGEGWGDMFLGVVGDHVPTALVELLTNLVTPGVQAQLAQQASLTGAR